MDARSIDLGDQRIDVPLRVFYPGYYPQLSSFTVIRGSTLNRRLWFKLLAAQPRCLFPLWELCGGSFGPLRIAWDVPALRLYEAPERSGIVLPERAQAVSARRRDRQDARSLPRRTELLRCLRKRVSAAGDGWDRHLLLCGRLRLPCRCCGRLLFARSLFLRGVRRVKAGTRDVVTRLTNNVSKLILGHQVESIAPAQDGVRIKLEGHEALHFDHVVLATQANQALDLVAPEFKRERAILEKFPYESSRVTMHRDTALAPKSKRDWSPVNFILKEGSAKPMATIWMNRVQPSLRKSKDVFQTWNPLIEPHPDLLLAEAKVERPIVTGTSVKAIKDLRELRHRQGSRLWVTGSYAQWGIPLLEAAVVSAIEVAESLGVSLPWN